MTDDNKAQEFARLFDLPENHTLKFSSSRKTEQNSVVYETRWIEQHDDKSKLVARFRTWSNYSLTPPYRRQHGWERFSLSGNLLDREVRYSRRKDMEYVH